MPGRRTHRVVGATAGAMAALVRAQNEPSDAQLIEVLGGLVGGCLGAAAPDWLEPATSPRHRAVCHSEAAVVACIQVSRRSLVRWELRWRTQSLRLEQECSSLEPGSWMFIVKGILAFLCRALAGTLAGFAAGYVSHISLDAMTPMGIGLLGCLCRRTALAPI